MSLAKKFGAAFGGGALVLTSFLVTATPAEAATFRVVCPGISPTEGYEPCQSDGLNVTAGKNVRIKNAISGGKGVNFRVRNSAGNFLLATTSLAAPGATVQAWRNNTSGTVNIQIEADPNSSSTVTVEADILIG